MPTPPNALPWSPGREQMFRTWFHAQVINAVGDHSELTNKWVDQIEQWRAPMPQGQKDFPWPGASNLEFPLTSIHFDPIYADFMQTFHGSGVDFWHVSPIFGPQDVDKANALRESLKILDRDFLRMRDINAKQFLYTILLGTGIYKTHYVRTARRVKDRDPDTGEVVERVTVREHPAVEYVPLNHFLLPGDAWDIDPDAPVGGARWVAQKFYETPAQMRAKASPEGDSVFLPAYDEEITEFVIHHTVGSLENEAEASSMDRGRDPVDQKVNELDKVSIFKTPLIELFEVWARFDIDDDGIDEDVVIIWHQDTQRILRMTPNPYDHGERPFDRVRYLEGIGFYGIGLAEKDEWSQATVTKLLNAQIDNVMLANTRMYSVPRGSNLSDQEAIFPGKVWTVGPSEDVKEVRLGDIYQSLPQIMGFMLDISESSSGASDLRQGNIQSLPDRTPATTTLTMLQESNKRFDEIMGGMRQPYSRIGLKVFQLLSQQMKTDPSFWHSYFIGNLGEVDGTKVIGLLEQGVDVIGQRFGIQPTATSAVANKEADKQNLVAVMQLLSQISPQLIQAGGLADQSQPGTLVHNTAVAMYVGGVELMTLLLERFDIQDAATFLPDVSQIQAQQAQQGQGVPQGAVSPLGGFFGPGPLAQGQNQLSSLLGI